MSNVCRPVSLSAGNGSTKSGIETNGPVASNASAMPQANQPAGAAGTASGGAGMMSSVAGMTSMTTTAGSASATGSAATNAGSGAFSMSGAGGAGGVVAGAAGSGSCDGGTCPECSVNDDCVRRGVAGSTCVDGMCWAPASECTTDQDCVSRGPEYVGGRCLTSQCRPNPKWRCEPSTASTTDGTTQLTLPVIDALSLMPVSRVHIVACNKLDLTCTKPVADATTGTDGQLKITVPANFAGYLQQTERTDYAPTLYFLPSVLPASGVLPNLPLLLSGAIIDALAFALGAGLDPKRGSMMLISDDCLGMTLPGVTFTSPQADKSSVQFYVRDQLPSTTANDTSDAGDGGFLNIPAGTTLITAKEVKSGVELATVSVLVRAGFISVSYIRPMTR